MNATLTRKTYPPVQADAEILCRWVEPCEAMPAGVAGFVRVNDAVYMLLPLADKGTIVGWRFTTSAGKVYDVDKSHMSCDCPDSQFRQRRCKHVAALLLVLAAERAMRERERVLSMA